MDNTTTKEVSEDVRKDAEEYADSKCKNKHIPFWYAHYYAFIAGAYSQKPIEHGKLPEHETLNPIYGNGKESKNNADSL